MSAAIFLLLCGLAGLATGLTMARNRKPKQDELTKLRLETKSND